MSNYEKYLKYKLKYQIIQLGGSHDDLVFRQSKNRSKFYIKIV